jgi:hypothetical protein
MINACTYRGQDSIAEDRVETFLDEPEPPGHAVQFYEADGRLLERNVCRYLLEGLRRGQGQLVVATPARIQAISREFELAGADPAAAQRDGRLTFLDAQETLAMCLEGGQPDWDRFESTLGAAMRNVRARADITGLRAYGEMVALLWNAGKYSAAIRLEKFWNKLLESNSFSMFCAYPIDVFGSEFQIGGLDAILRAHTHFLPAGTNQDLENAVDQSMNEILGRRAEGLRSLIKASSQPSWAAIPRAEATILWLRNSLSDEAEEILARARLRYRASQSLRSHSPKNSVQ